MNKVPTHKSQCAAVKAVPLAAEEKSTSEEDFFLLFVVDQIDQFAAEAERLGDPVPLDEYKALIDTFYFIDGKLGTIEHEVSLHKISSEFALASKESVDARRSIWRDLRERRLRGIATERAMSQYHRRVEVLLAGLEKSYSEMEDHPDNLRKSMRAALDAARRATEVGKGLGASWRKFFWVSLYVNLRVYSVYLRYSCAKVIFFVFRHSFILVTSILLFGIGYGKASRVGLEQIAGIFPRLPWVLSAVTVGAYLLKKYYIDPKLKKLQIKLETRWLSRLVRHLHLVRTMALVSRTARRRSPTEA